MPENAYEIRKCDACGLRYPIPVDHPLGIRCPVCMGETHLILRRSLSQEPTQRPGTVPPIHTAASRAVILDNLRSAWNVGSILRSADGFGFTHVYACGITPTPDNEAVTKTALGAQDAVPWSYHKDAVQLVRGLRKEGWTIVALEGDARAHDIQSAVLRDRDWALIVGNEVTGVDPDLLDLADEILSIPMRGEKKSFNVAVAFGVAAFALDRRA